MPDDQTSQTDFAKKICKVLDSSTSQVSPDLAARLEFSRKQAVALFKQKNQVHHINSSSTLSLSQFWQFKKQLKYLWAFLALITALVGIEVVNDSFEDILNIPTIIGQEMPAWVYQFSDTRPAE